MKKQVIVHTAHKAISHLNKMSSALKDWDSRLRVFKDEPLSTNEMTLEHHMMQNSMPPTLAGKVAQARKIGMSHYNGSKEHDNTLLSVLQGKSMSEDANKAKESEYDMKEREHKLKEKEISIKENESKQKEIKPLSADEIADSLLKKFK